MVWTPATFWDWYTDRRREMGTFLFIYLFILMKNKMEISVSAVSR